MSLTYLMSYQTILYLQRVLVVQQDKQILFTTKHWARETRAAQHKKKGPTH